MKLLDALFSFMFPPKCEGCGVFLRSGVLCKKCEGEIRLFNAFTCPVCRARVPEAKLLCHKSGSYLLGAAMDYRTPGVKGLVRALKFHGRRRAAEILGDYLVRYSRSLPLEINEFDMVTSIPLSTGRIRQRGFNQAELIALHCATAWNVPHIPNLLVRAKDTLPQSEMKGKDARDENVSGCFDAPSTTVIKGMRIILIDDVVTSGATLREAVRTLKDAGARRVVALTAARA